jgi:hypothetical protein
MSLSASKPVGAGFMSVVVAERSRLQRLCAVDAVAHAECGSFQ